MSRTYFKLTGSWANRCPNVMGMSVTFVRGKVDDANVYFKPNVSLSVGLKEMGLSAGALSPPVHMGAPRTLHHKPMTPAMLATYPTEQTLTGVTVRGAKRILVIVYPKAGVQISFMGR